MKKEEMKQYIDQQVEAIGPELMEISQYIFQHPEVAHTEHKACAKQIAYLKSKGYEITENPAGVDTAFVATYRNGEGPHIAVLSEYDCLPNGLDHACGHNLIAAASMGAGAAMIEAMKKFDIKGTFSVIGARYEEIDGGKIDLLKGGVFDDVDACMAVHPTTAMSRVAGECLCSSHYVIEYRGQTAHAWARPWKGKNAFDAAIVCFNAVAMMRQQTEDGVRIDYGFVEGYEQTGSVRDYVKLTLGLHRGGCRGDRLPRRIPWRDGIQKQNPQQCTGRTVPRKLFGSGRAYAAWHAGGQRRGGPGQCFACHPGHQPAYDDFAGAQDL